MHALGAVATLGPDWMDPAYLLSQYGDAFFWLAIVIVFIECGLLFPILPGDSMLFVAGAIVALAGLNLHGLVALLIAAAIIGNSINYALGRYFGERAFANKNSRIFKPIYLDRTRAFYDKYGPTSPASSPSFAHSCRFWRA